MGARRWLGTLAGLLTMITPFGTKGMAPNLSKAVPFRWCSFGYAFLSALSRMRSFAKADFSD
jgi:hypothetical protein